MQKDRAELIESIFEKFENLGKQMHRGARFLRHEMHKRKMRNHHHGSPFEDLDLNRKQTIFLFIIAKSKDGITSKDLSMFFWISPGAVTQFIDKLIEKNLVVREEDPDDRRNVRIKLTDYAKKRFDEFKKGYISSLAPFFDNFSDEELDQLSNLLNKISIPHEFN